MLLLKVSTVLLYAVTTTFCLSDETVQEITEALFEQELELEKTIVQILLPVHASQLQQDILYKTLAIARNSNPRGTTQESIESIRMRRDEMIQELQSMQQQKNLRSGTPEHQEKFLKILKRLSNEICTDIVKINDLLQDKKYRKAASIGMWRAREKVNGLGQSRVDASDYDDFKNLLKQQRMHRLDDKKKQLVAKENEKKRRREAFGGNQEG